MNLRDRWAKRGPAWRMPSWEEAKDNLSSGLGGLFRWWVLIALVVICGFTLLASQDMQNPRSAWIAAGLVSLGLLRMAVAFGQRR